LIELKKAVALDPRLPMLHYHLGMVYRHNGMLPEAKAEFLADLAIEPRVAEALDQLGEVEYSLGDIASSRKDLYQAIQFNPRLGTAWFYLAKIHLKDAKYDAALAALSKAAAVDDKSTNVHYLRAQVLKQMGRQKEAAAEFATVKRLEQETTSRLEKEINGGYRDPELDATRFAKGAASPAPKTTGQEAPTAMVDCRLLQPERETFCEASALFLLPYHSFFCLPRHPFASPNGLRSPCRARLRLTAT